MVTKLCIKYSIFSLCSTQSIHFYYVKNISITLLLISMSNNFRYTVELNKCLDPYEVKGSHKFTTEFVISRFRTSRLGRSSDLDPNKRKMKKKNFPSVRLSVCLSVRLSVCHHDNSSKSEPIL